MKVLMATDGSKPAMTALGTASRLLRKGASPFQVLCVAPEFNPPASRRQSAHGKTARLREEYRRQISVETGRIIQEALESLRSEGVEAEGRTEVGSPAEVILRVAEEFDVTVIGAHGRHERTKPGLGPVASRVVEYAAGTVLVAREMVTERSPRILLGVDGSLASDQALRVLASYFNVTSAEITLMHVVETPWTRLGLDRAWFDYPDDYPEVMFDRVDARIGMEREMRVEAEAVIDDARRMLDHLGLSASTIVGEGNPATEILGEAEAGEYDLIVVGATGITDVKHEMVGSVSTKVAWHAPCSVAVVKYYE